MATIRERILARPDLHQARVERNIDVLAAGLNQECQPALVPARTNLANILSMMEHGQVLYDFVQAVANGENRQAFASALLTDEGVEVMVWGLNPPEVTRWDVNDAMFNPDGSEKE